MSALEKLLKGEVMTAEESKEIKPEEIQSLTADQIAALPLEVKSRLDAQVLLSINGRRQELQRLSERKTDQEGDFEKRFHGEQVQKAEGIAFTQLQSSGIELTEELKTKIRETRKKLDSGAVTFENIVTDFLAAAAAVKGPDLLDSNKKRLDFEKDAATFTSHSAGANGSGGSSGGGDNTYSEEVMNYVKEARAKGINLTPEQAKKVLAEGLTRRL